MANINKALYRWKEVIIITVLTKFLLFILPLFTKPVTTNLFNSWVRWDGPHYMDIAKNWYQPTGEQSLFIVFYPLYPLLVKVTSFLMNDFQISAIAISCFFSFITAIILFELALIDFSKKAAVQSVWFLNIFPTAYFLQASYTESLYLSLSLATVYLFRKKFFALAGGLGALSTLTRINGLFLIPALFLERSKVKSLITLFLIPFGFLEYLLINYIIFNNPFYFSKVLSSNWFKKIEWPWVSLQNLISYIPGFQNPNFYIYFSELVTIIFIAIMTIIVYFKVRKTYAVYMFLNLLLFLSMGYVLSTPRYALCLFPIFIALGLINNRKAIAIMSAVSLALLFYFTNLYIQGRWAF